MINIDLTKEQGVNIEFTSNIVYGGEGGKTVDVVQSTGSSKNAVMSQDAVTRELNTLEDKIDKIDIPKLPELAEVATSGSYNDLKDRPTIPSIDGLASTTEVEEALNSAKSYTNEKFNDINIPTSLSELSDDKTHRLVTDEEKQSWNSKSDFSGDYNDLKNKPTIPSLDGYATEQYVQQQIGSINEVLTSIING